MKKNVIYFYFFFFPFNFFQKTFAFLVTPKEDDMDVNVDWQYGVHLMKEFTTCDERDVRAKLPPKCTMSNAQQLIGQRVESMSRNRVALLHTDIKSKNYYLYCYYIQFLLFENKELFEILINASGVSGGGQLAAALTNCLFQTDLFEERLNVNGFKEFIKQ